MRVSVFEAKLLTQTDCPAGATEGAGASLAGRAMRIGSPTFFPECTSIRVTVPSSWSVTNSEPAAAASQLGFVPTRIGSPTGRSERGSSRTTLPPSWSANQTLPPVTTIPIGNPPTCTRLIACVAGSIRSTSPVSAAVTQR